MKTKTKTKTNRGCKCIDKVDELLRKQGASLDIAFMVPEMYCRVSISTYRVQPGAVVRVQLGHLQRDLRGRVALEHPRGDLGRG
jgi:hypothetical protein